MCSGALAIAAPSLAQALTLTLSRGAGEGTSRRHRASRILLICALLLPIPARAEDPDAVAALLRGREVVERGAEAHGGLARFRALGVLRARIRDEWPFPGSILSPWPANPAEGLAAFDFASNKARVKLDAPEGVAWGFDSARGWTEADGRGARGDDADASFILRTTAYYVSLPFRLLEPGATYRYARREGAFDVVEVRFEDRPDRPGDRFLVRYDAETGRLAWTENTARERSRWAEGTIRYRAFAEAAGILWPSEVELRLTKPFPLALHTLRLSDLEEVPAFDRALFETPKLR